MSARCPGTLNRTPASPELCEWATKGGCTTPCVKRDKGLTDLDCTSKAVYRTPHQPHPWAWATSEDQTPRYWCDGWRTDGFEPAPPTPRPMSRVLICEVDR